MITELNTEKIRAAMTALALAAGLLATSGCRQNMHNQHKIEPYETSDFFADGQASRQLPDGVVPLGTYGEEVAPYTGLVVAQNATFDGPPPVTPELLQRGQQRFNIYCSPCHGRMGDGRGMIVRRGYKQPTSFHDPRLRGAQVDYFFTVMTEGFGVMPSYKEEVAVPDRWAIAAYIRALQYSQNARLADLPADQRQALETELAQPQLGAPGSSADRHSAAGGSATHPDPSEVSNEHE